MVKIHMLSQTASASGMDFSRNKPAVLFPEGFEIPCGCDLASAGITLLWSFGVGTH